MSIDYHNFTVDTEWLNAGPLGQALVKEHENEEGKDRLSDFDMAISEADTSRVLVLLKESDIREASIAKPVEWKMSIICFGFNGNSVYERVCLHRIIQSDNDMCQENWLFSPLQCGC